MMQIHFIWYSPWRLTNPQKCLRCCRAGCNRCSCEGSGKRRSSPITCFYGAGAYSTDGTTSGCTVHASYRPRQLCDIRHGRQASSSSRWDSMGDRGRGTPGLSNGLLTPRWHHIPSPCSLVTDIT